MFCGVMKTRVWRDAARRVVIVVAAGGAVASPAALATASPAAASQWQGDVKDYPTTYQLYGRETSNHITVRCPDDHPFLNYTGPPHHQRRIASR